jgi:WD40 repeat protein
MAARRPVLAVAVAATVVAIGVLAFRGTRPDSPVVTRAAGTSPSVPVPGGAGDGSVDPTLVSAGRPAPDGPRPNEIAAIVGGSVVLLDGRDGHTLRTLATHTEATTGGFPYLEGVALTPDRKQVFYALAGDCGAATIYRVAADGRTPPTALFSGVSPAVSPDGRKLAYAAATPGPVADPAPASGAETPPAERRCQNAIVVRDLTTGVERAWRYPDTPDFTTNLYRDAVISEIAWAPDSSRLAYTLSYEGDSISVLDTQTETDLSQTAEVVIPGGGGNSSHPAWQATTGLLGLFNTRFECCYDDNYTGPPKALLLNTDRRLATALLPSGRRVTALDFDASGAHLLFVDGGRLYRRSGAQVPVALATGVTAADW